MNNKERIFIHYRNNIVYNFVCAYKSGKDIKYVTKQNQSTLTKKILNKNGFANKTSKIVILTVNIVVHLQ